MFKRERCARHCAQACNSQCHQSAPQAIGTPSTHPPRRGFSSHLLLFHSVLGGFQAITAPRQTLIAGTAEPRDRSCIAHRGRVRCRSCHAAPPWGATAVPYLSHVVSDAAAKACAQAPAAAPAVKWRRRRSTPCARTCRRPRPALRRVRPPHSAVRDAPPHSRARWHRWRWFHHPPIQSGQRPTPR